MLLKEGSEVLLVCAGGVACCIRLNKLFYFSQLVAAASRCHKWFCSQMRFTEHV